jgi:hypothetical protein
MKARAQLLPLVALGVTTWAALWSLIALSNPQLPAVSERTMVEQPAKAAHQDIDESTRVALEAALSEKAGEALRERLGPGHRFEVTHVESLTLRAKDAEARLWGLLFAGDRQPSMLRVDLRMNRHSQQVDRLYAQAFNEHDEDPFLTAWISNGPGVLQAAR